MKKLEDLKPGQEFTYGIRTFRKIQGFDTPYGILSILSIDENNPHLLSLNKTEDFARADPDKIIIKTNENK